MCINNSSPNLLLAFLYDIVGTKEPDGCEGYCNMVLTVHNSETSSESFNQKGVYAESLKTQT